MPDKREQMFNEINSEGGYGVFLMGQMDSVPETLQLVIATTQYDGEADGLRDRSRYVVRCIGVQEHRFSIGLFENAHLFEKGGHPLLYEYNLNPAALFFRGQPAHPQELLLDLIQTYSSVFQDWRHIPRYLNLEKPLLELLNSGGALLGQMPVTLGQQLEKVLLKHGLETKLLEDQRPKDQPLMKTLLLDDSYVVAMDFSVDELGKA